MDAKVVIAGAGPVGLGLALGLSLHGIPCLVLDKKQALSPHSRAPAIHARTLEILQAWGALEAFLEEGTFLQELRFWLVGCEDPVACLDLNAMAPLTAVPGLLVLPQDRTEAILLDRIRALGMADVRFGHTLAGFQQDDVQVTVAITSQDGVPYTVTTRYLVGCDGAHSTVRERLGWLLEGKTYPTRLMLADVRLSDARNDLPWPRGQVTAETLRFALRIEPDLWRIISTIRDGESEAAAVSQAAIAERVDALFGAGPFVTVWASTFHIHCRTSPHFRLGRVLLAGDAAHLNSPVGGQGMNAGIQDAHNLAWKLARALEGGQAEALLASYEAERRPAILRSVDRFTDLLTRFALLAGPNLRSASARLARMAITHPRVMARLAPKFGMLDVRYGPSPILVGNGRWIGARAPDGDLRDALGQPSRLYDHVAREAVLLLFDDGRMPRWDRDEVARAVSSLPGLKVFRLLETTASPELGDLRDARGSLWEQWKGRGGMVVLVRPDGYVGWRANRPTLEAIRTHVAWALGERLP